MKLELIGHDEKYALEQSLLTLFPGEKPVYGTVDKTADTRWARVTLTEEDERVQVTTELGVDGKSAAHSYDYPLSGTEYEKEGQRRHAVGISFFGAAKDLLGISPVQVSKKPYGFISGYVIICVMILEKADPYLNVWRVDLQNVTSILLYMPTC